MKNIKLALTFDDVLLIPQQSNVTPDQISLKTNLTKNITLNIPIVSAAMDTVTEYELAIALACEGGIGFIHKNMSIEDQAKQVEKVKRYKIGVNSNALKDSKGRLRVGAAVGVSNDSIKRVDALVKAKVDVICIDSAHGHSANIIKTVKVIRKKYPKLDIVAGNIVTPKAAEDLAKAGANCVKIGVGPGSICTTRVIAGVGIPQITAILETAAKCKHLGINCIADGGIKLSGDITKALAAGADCVMLGSLLAGCKESPGKVITCHGKKFKICVGMGSIAAMKRGSKDRYFQANVKLGHKLVPEGIEGRVTYKGELSKTIYQLCGGLRSGMGYCGSGDIKTLHKKAEFVQITNAGLKESHPHDIEITTEAPNYCK